MTKIRVCSALCLLILLLAGCSRKTEEATAALSSYRENIETVFTEISSIYDRLEDLDSSDSTDSEAFLAAMDDLAAAFRRAADLTAPEGFASEKAMLEEAADTMQSAADDYRTAFSTKTPDTEVLSRASNEYGSAQAKLQEVIELLRERADENE